MPRKPSTIESTRLAIAILRAIPKGRRIDTNEIRAKLAAEGIERDVRSIQRLLDQLVQHYDIERDERGKPYTYRWKEMAKGLMLPVLSDQEALVLLLARRHLETMLPSSVLRSMTGVFESAERFLSPSSGRKTAGEWMHKVGVVSQLQPLIPAKLQAGVMEAVTHALYEDEWLDVAYVNLDGVGHSSRVMPLAMVQQEARLFLVCRFDGYDDVRNLALHRIGSAKSTGLRFERPPFDLQAYDDAGGFGFGNGKKIKLRFVVPRDIALILEETPLSTDQVQRSRADGRIEVLATVSESARLRWWLGTYGDRLEVLSPVRLRR